MVTELKLGSVVVEVVFKDIRNVHLSVYPPTGRVRVSAPRRMNLDAVRLFAASKIGWIRKHQGKARQRRRESPREYLERESHYVWGRRYLLRIRPAQDKPSVAITHRVLELQVPAKSSSRERREILDSWYRRELRGRAEPLVAKWEKQLGVTLDRFFIQRMKTKWGSSNPKRNTIRLNLELARHAPHCLDYVILHEMAHMLVPNHSEAFTALLDRHMPGWRITRQTLNETEQIPLLN